MLRKIADHIKYCFNRAAEARERANEATDPVLKAEYLNTELGWLRLARSCEFVDSLDNFLGEHRSTPALVWHQRILESYESLIVEDAHEECGDRRTTSLIRHGPYEVRLAELSRNLPAEGAEHLWLELFDHDHQRTIESYAGRTLVDITAAAESLCSKAKRLSSEYAARLPVVAIIDDDPDILKGLDLLLSSCDYRRELFASAEDFLGAEAIPQAACLVVD